MKLKNWIKFALVSVILFFSAAFAAENAQNAAPEKQPVAAAAQNTDATAGNSAAENTEGVAATTGASEPLMNTALSGEELNSLIELLNNPARIEEFKGNLELLKKLGKEIPKEPEIPVAPAQITEGLLGQAEEAFFEARKSFDVLFDTQLSIIPKKEVKTADGKTKYVPQTGKFLIFLAGFSAFILFCWVVCKQIFFRIQIWFMEGRKIHFLLRFCLRTFLLAILIAIIYYSVSYLLIKLLGDDYSLRVTIQMLIQPFLVVLFLDAFAILVLGPEHTSYGLLRLRKPVSRWLLVRSRLLWGALFFFLVSYQITEILYKSGLHVIHFSVFVTGLIYIVAFYIFMLAVRRVVLLYYNVNRKESQLVWLYDWVVEYWHVPALFYVGGVGFFWFLDMQDHKEALFLNTVGMVIGFICMLSVVNFIHYISLRIQDVIDDRTHTNRKLRKQSENLKDINHYIFLLLKIAVIIAYIVIMLEVLGVPLLKWFSEERGSKFLSVIISLGAIIGTWFLIREVLNAFIYRYLNATNDGGEFMNNNARIRTVLPLLKNVVLIILAVILFLLALMSLGINTTPILAASGVFGIAIAFGSQKLVSDFITGMFFLIEDTMQVGEIVEVNGLSGTIEELSIRTLKLRDLNGSVHTVPFGSIEQVSNLTKGFSYALMEIGVAYRENVDEVMEVLVEIGAEMYDDTPWRYYIVEEFELLGLDSFGDNSVNIKCRFKTRADKKWTVRREFNRRVKNRFDALGIEIPFPHVTLYFGEDKEGNAPAMQVQRKKETKKEDKIEETQANIEEEKKYPVIDSDVLSDDQ